MPGEKKAVVSGGGRGLGRAIALRLADRGYDVGILGRSAEYLDLVVADARSRGGSRVLPRVCDVSKWEQVRDAMPALISELGGAAVLVNNAGGWMPGALVDADPAAIQRLLESSVLGAAFCAKAVLPFMIAAGTGFILNIGSTSGLDSSRDNAGSSAPKGGIRAFSRALGLEVERQGVRVGVLHPASVEKSLPFDEAPPRNSDGVYNRLGQAQVADIAIFMIEQPPNVTIRELVVTPSGVFR